jgi:hypothetical protein
MEGEGAEVGTLRRLWAGEVPLARAFWEYAMVYGFVLNLFTTIASFALLTTDAPAAFGLAIFFLPMPYNLFVLVAVWRAAARYVGPRHWASYARVAVVLWVLLVTLV